MITRQSLVDKGARAIEIFDPDYGVLNRDENVLYLNGHIFELNATTNNVRVIWPERYFHTDRLRVVPQFFWSDYWGRWSRVLYASGCFIELDLTPYGGVGHMNWQREKLEVIRVHSTMRKTHDILTDHLPEHVRSAMVKNLGGFLTEKMISHDYLAEFPLDSIIHANNCSNGGGVPIQFIRDLENGRASTWTWPT